MNKILYYLLCWPVIGLFYAFYWPSVVMVKILDTNKSLWISLPVLFVGIPLGMLTLLMGMVTDYLENVFGVRE